MLLRCGSRTVDLSRPVVMGVLNVTPDSFSDGGRYLDTAAAIARARQMVEEGAAIIDVGGESTRPGAEPVLVEEELRRVLPVIEALAGRVDAVISVDTRRPSVMRDAIAAGAGLVNDVAALREPGALECVAGTNCAVCLMHMLGEPRTMQRAPAYADVVNDIKAFLDLRVHACREAGIAPERIVIDPGFGFGKTLAHNLELLRRLNEFAAGGLPVLVGLSRKSMVAGLTGLAPRDGMARPPARDRLAGSLALATLAVARGARIVRAHDVAPTVDAVRVAAAVELGEL